MIGGNKFKLYETSRGLLLLGREYQKITDNGTEVFIDGFPLNDPNDKKYRYSRWNGWSKKYFKLSNREFNLIASKKYFKPYYDFVLSDNDGRLYLHNRGKKVWILDLPTGFVTNITFSELEQMERGNFGKQYLTFKNKI